MKELFNINNLVISKYNIHLLVKKQNPMKI